ncbi:hypothetical protein, partial [Salmonella enterica]|uniref:hypothetical protein n=1 Tax=Salmonella enterica TaxID=28901 RepID=UPI0021B195E8
PQDHTQDWDSKAGFGQLCHVREFHDGEYSYSVAAPNGTDGKAGDFKMVYQEKNVTGGLPPFIVLPGNPQRDNDPKLNWRPIFWPLYA